MRATPYLRLLARGLRGRCPICGRGPLFQAGYSLRAYCPACGFRYRRDAEYGAQGYQTGAATITMLVTGAVAAAALVWLAVVEPHAPLAPIYLAGTTWAVVFPALFYRVAFALWMATDLRLNWPGVAELAAAPPRRP